MVALQEEEERFQQMQQYQDAITGGGGSVGSSLSDASTPSSPHESLSENTSSPALRRQGTIGI